jgi:hypothetical protein
MSGIKSRRKGCRFELAIARLLQDAGLGAEKISRAGYSGGDLTCPCLGRDLILEVKARARGFSQIYEWLQDRDALIIRADRREPLVVVPWKLAIQIATVAESHSSLPRQRQPAEPAAP